MNIKHIPLFITLTLISLPSIAGGKNITMSDHEEAIKRCKQYGGYASIQLNKARNRMDVHCVRGGKVIKGILRK